MNTADTAVRAIIRRRLEQPLVDATRRLPGVPELMRTQRSRSFERGRTVRKVLGAFRYGTFAEGRLRDVRYRNIESAIDRLQAYLQGGNMEHLLDAANLCEIEWDQPGSHPHPHFTPTDDGPHKQIKL